MFFNFKREKEKEGQDYQQEEQKVKEVQGRDLDYNSIPQHLNTQRYTLKYTNMIIKITKLECKRCRHSWIPKKEEVRQCPKCKSAYWDKEKEGFKNETQNRH